MKNGDDTNSIARVLMGVVSAKFGPGALGRIGTLAICGMVCLTMLAFVMAFINVYVSGTIIILVAALLFYTLERSFRYADAHPELAAMDGAQISKLLHQQASMRPLEGLNSPPTDIVITTQNPDLNGQEF